VSRTHNEKCYLEENQIQTERVAPCRAGQKQQHEINNKMQRYTDRSIFTNSKDVLCMDLFITMDRYGPFAGISVCVTNC